MSKETAVITLGFLVIIMPFLGFPEAWRTGFIFIFGVALVVVGFFLRTEFMARRRKEGGVDSSYMENNNFHRRDEQAQHEENTGTHN